MVNDFLLSLKLRLQKYFTGYEGEKGAFRTQKIRTTNSVRTTISDTRNLRGNPPLVFFL